MLESWDGWGHDYNITRSILQHGLSGDVKHSGKKIYLKNLLVHYVCRLLIDELECCLQCWPKIVKFGTLLSAILSTLAVFWAIQ